LGCFCGSGAVAFEAISRGAKSAFITEIDKSTARIIEKNIKDLGLTNQIKVTKVNANSWSESNQAATFDLVICDPPYDDIKDNQLELLTQNVKEAGYLSYLCHLITKDLNLIILNQS